MRRSMVLLGCIFLLVWAFLSLASAPIARAADASRCEPQQLGTKYPSLVNRTIRAGEDGESPPYSMRDPKNFDDIIGVDGDMIRAVFRCIGAKFEFKTGAWSGLLPAIIAGQTDTMWYLYYTPERAKQVNFVVFMKAGTGALVRKGNPKHIKSMSDICGDTATAGLGTVEEASLRQQSSKCQAAGNAAITILTYPDIPSGTRMIVNDRADVLLTDLSLVDKLSNDNPTLFERGFKILSDLKIAVGVNKKDEDLVRAIYDATRILQQNGTEAKILKTYGIDPSLIAPTVILRQ